MDINSILGNKGTGKNSNLLVWIIVGFIAFSAFKKLPGLKLNALLYGNNPPPPPENNHDDRDEEDYDDYEEQKHRGSQRSGHNNRGRSTAARSGRSNERQGRPRSREYDN